MKERILDSSTYNDDVLHWWFYCIACRASAHKDTAVNSCHLWWVLNEEFHSTNLLTEILSDLLIFSQSTALYLLFCSSSSRCPTQHTSATVHGSRLPANAMRWSGTMWTNTNCKQIKWIDTKLLYVNDLIHFIYLKKIFTTERKTLNVNVYLITPSDALWWQTYWSTMA